VSLSCDCGWDEGPELWQPEDRTARKQHVCGECRRTIEPGDEYRRIFYVYEGDASAHKMCERCADLDDSLAALGFCWAMGELREAHLEYIQEYVPFTWSDDEETQLWNGRTLESFDIRSAA